MLETLLSTRSFFGIEVKHFLELIKCMLLVDKIYRKKTILPSTNHLNTRKVLEQADEAQFSSYLGIDPDLASNRANFHERVDQLI